MASPVFFIKKKDSSLRLFQDYRALNAMTVKNKYPLPLISELINKLQGAKYFTKLNVCWGFNNVQMKEGDEWKVAFHTNHRLFELLIMFFRLCNSPATLQTMMNDIFDNLISEGVVVVYLDDILIFTKLWRNIEPSLGGSCNYSRRTASSSNWRSVGGRELKWSTSSHDIGELSEDGPSQGHRSDRVASSLQPQGGSIFP